MSEIRRINHNDNNYDEIDAMGAQIMGEFDALAQRVRDEGIYSTQTSFGQNEKKVEFYEDLYQRILDRKNQRSHVSQDVHDPSYRVVRNRPESIAPRVSPVRYLLNIPDGEDTKEFIKALPYSLREQLGSDLKAFYEGLKTASSSIYEQTSTAQRKMIATMTIAGILATGVVMSEEGSHRELAAPSDGIGLVYERTSSATVVQLGDLANQDIEKSVDDVANVLQVGDEEQSKIKVKGNELILPVDLSEDELVASYIAFNAPDSTVSTTDAPETPAIGTETGNTGEDAGNVPLEVQALNNAIKKIDINSQKIDITEIRDAVISLDKWYAPNDKDRMSNMPSGYVKVLLGNEAIGLDIPLTVAERTANVERYTSPTLAAVTYASAYIFQQLITQKYPQYTGAMYRLRDFNAPVHLTHNDGRQADISGAINIDVTQYATGPFADYQFSKNFNKQFTIDMFSAMAKLSDSDGLVISSILYSGKTVPSIVNSMAGRNFLQKKADHKDHGHITLMKRFAMPQWRPRLADLPWDQDQDLRIANMAKPITQEQHASQHQNFEDYMKGNGVSTGAVDGSKDVTTDPSGEISKESQDIIDSLNLKPEQKDFLRTMLPAIRDVYRDGAHINPAVVLAQTSLETGFGQSKLSSEANNYFGMKAGKSWTGEVYVVDTKEEYKPGEVVTIKDSFRKYDNPVDSVRDYVEKIENSEHYADAVINYKDALGYVNGLFNEVDDKGNIIKEQGEPGVLSYGTDRGYEEKVMSLISSRHYMDLMRAEGIDPMTDTFDKSDKDAKNRKDNTHGAQDKAQAKDDGQPTTTSVIENPASDNQKEGSKEIEYTYFDEDATRNIYQPYFKDDAEGLDKWIASLPTKEIDGQIKFGVSVKNTPDSPSNSKDDMKKDEAKSSEKASKKDAKKDDKKKDTEENLKKGPKSDSEETSKDGSKEGK